MPWHGFRQTVVLKNQTKSHYNSKMWQNYKKNQYCPIYFKKIKGAVWTFFSTHIVIYNYYA